tara:strand:- start:391 stop:798 length:408 start_codon:yes stop_codon:yes gene_type:complete
MYTQCRNILPVLHLFGDNPLFAELCGVAHAPVVSNHMMLGVERGAILCGLAQAANEINGHRVVIIIAELQTGLGRILAGAIQDFLHDLALRTWLVYLDCDLRHCAYKVTQAVNMRCRQAVTDDNNHLPIFIGLGA